MPGVKIRAPGDTVISLIISTLDATGAVRQAVGDSEESIPISSPQLMPGTASRRLRLPCRESAGSKSAHPPQ